MRRWSAATSVRRGTFVASVRPCTPESVDISAASGRSVGRLVAPEAEERARRRVAAAVVADLVEVDPGEQPPQRRALGRASERPRPVLDLRVAGKEEPLVAGVEHEDHARVVERVVDRAHDPQQRRELLAFQPLDEPGDRPGRERGPPARAGGAAGTAVPRAAPCCASQYSGSSARWRVSSGTCSTVGGPRTRTVIPGTSPRSASRRPRRGRRPRPFFAQRSRFASAARFGSWSEASAASSPRSAAAAGRTAPARRRGRRTPGPPRAPRRSGASRSGARGAWRRPGASDRRSRGARRAPARAGRSPPPSSSSPKPSMWSLCRWVATSTSSRPFVCCSSSCATSGQQAAAGPAPCVEPKSNRMCRSARPSASARR